ncbi:MAG TPA: hypothetical protein VFS67_29145 [Polyangiaceae bacterium]|nr:hypothetical protein [Polyangiaceae bacterium]
MPPSSSHLPHVGSIAAILTILHAPAARAQNPGAAPYPSGPYAQTQYPSSPYPSGPYPGSQPSYPPASNPPLQSGGLTPPSSSPASAGEAETYRQLDRAEREDAGRGLEFVWFQAEAGYEYLSLDDLHGNALVDASVIGDGGSALLLGVGGGVRLIFLTIGARFRMARQSAWDLWTLNGEVGLHLPMGELEPSFTLSAGYASLGAIQPEHAPPGFDPDRVDISGFDTRLGAALDWYLNPMLSLGLQSNLELLVLSRSKASQPGLGSDAAELVELYARDGSGVGFGVSISAMAGLHF